MADYSATTSDGTATSIDSASLTQKVTPVAADRVRIEDSAASNAPKWVEVGDLPGGGVVEISPSSIGANQNNYNPTNWDTATVVRLSSDAAYDITGFDDTVTAKLKKIFNVGSFNITLKNQSVSSTAANRMVIPGGDLILAPDDIVEIYNDATTARWRVG